MTSGKLATSWASVFSLIRRKDWTNLSLLTPLWHLQETLPAPYSQGHMENAIPAAIPRMRDTTAQGSIRYKTYPSIWAANHSKCFYWEVRGNGKGRRLQKKSPSSIYMNRYCSELHVLLLHRTHLCFLPYKKPVFQVFCSTKSRMSGCWVRLQCA